MSVGQDCSITVYHKSLFLGTVLPGKTQLRPEKTWQKKQRETSRSDWDRRDERKIASFCPRGLTRIKTHVIVLVI
jgi:hypothetical protein